VSQFTAAPAFKSCWSAERRGYRWCLSLSAKYSFAFNCLNSSGISFALSQQRIIISLFKEVWRDLRRNFPFKLCVLMKKIKS